MLLFVVLGSLSTMVFGISSIIAKIKGKVCRRISIGLDITGILIVLILLGFVFYGFLVTYDAIIIDAAKYYQSQSHG